MPQSGERHPHFSPEEPGARFAFAPSYRDVCRVYCSLHTASYGIQCLMFEVKRTDAFDAWLKGLKDSKGRSRIQARIDRLANGNPGDVRPIGEGLSELRIDFGPGDRVYYARTGKTLYLLLCGGDKSSQDADIKNAHAMWRELNPPAKKPARKE